MNYFKSILLAGLLFVSVGMKAQNSLAIFFDKADQFFQNYVSNGLVDYEAIKHDPSKLNALTAIMSEINLAGSHADERKAFWINAYNITMIRAIVKHFPLQSPLDIPGLFDIEKFPITGEALTLESIEKQKLMSAFDDERLHFVLVCAAIGCPKLADFAYRPDGLDEMLDKRTRLAINNSSFTRVNHSEHTIQLSQIFNWYKTDFLKRGKSLLAYVNRYRDIKISTGYRVEFYEYNWSLNINQH